MAFNDLADKALIRLELRRFVGRCENNVGLVQRADSLRELARLASTTVPYKLAAEFDARDAQRRLLLSAEDRAKEVIAAQIAAMLKLEVIQRDSSKSRMLADWSNLTGALGHLRTWAKSKLTLAEQSFHH